MQIETCAYCKSTSMASTTRGVRATSSTRDQTHKFNKDTKYTKSHTHSTLCYSYTADHKGTVKSNIINNSNHTTLNTDTPIRVVNTTYKQASSPDITSVFSTLYNNTTWSPIAFTTNIPILQTLRNTALHIATGYTFDTSIKHLHDEKHIQPIHTYT